MRFFNVLVCLCVFMHVLCFALLVQYCGCLFVLLFVFRVVCFCLFYVACEVRCVLCGMCCV